MISSLNSSDILPSLLLYIMQAEGLSFDAAGLATYFDAVGRYCRVHRELFGIYEGELMREPDDEAIWKRLEGSLEDFLAREGLELMQSTLDAMLAIPGYG